MAWYEEWFGEEYLDLYSHRDAGEADRHTGFVERLFGDDDPGLILDLASGAGRHSESLIRRGYRAVGVDLSLVLLAKGVGLPRVAGDMRRLPFAAGVFGWVLNFFTSFGYFDTERQNFLVLEEMVRVLAPGGRFLIDLMSLDHTLDNLREAEERRVGERRVEISRWWDAESRRINKKIRLLDAEGAPRTYLESVRAYSHDEVVIGLRWAGLEVTEAYGNFNGETYTDDSERLILVGHKSE